MLRTLTSQVSLPIMTVEDEGGVTYQERCTETKSDCGALSPVEEMSLKLVGSAIRCGLRCLLPARGHYWSALSFALLEDIASREVNTALQRVRYSFSAVDIAK
jgi:hypothetical protein